MCGQPCFVIIASSSCTHLYFWKKSSSFHFESATSPNWGVLWRWAIVGTAESIGRWIFIVYLEVHKHTVIGHHTHASPPPQTANWLFINLHLYDQYTNNQPIWLVLLFFLFLTTLPCRKRTVHQHKKVMRALPVKSNFRRSRLCKKLLLL